MADADDMRGRRLYDRLMELKPADLLEGEWAKQAGVNRGFFTDLKKASGGAPRSDTLRKVLRHIGRTEAELYGAEGNPRAREAGHRADRHEQPATRSADSGETADTVGIESIDMAYGLGAAFADSPVEVDLLHFPKAWIEEISHSHASHLFWTRGRGDSMEPTIKGGDLVLVDRSQRVIREPDALWAYAVGTTASIKRLRLKGDRVQVFSDNEKVPPDEEMLADVHIVGRVVFVGSKK